MKAPQHHKQLLFSEFKHRDLNPGSQLTYFALQKKPITCTYTNERQNELWSNTTGSTYGANSPRALGPGSPEVLTMHGLIKALSDVTFELLGAMEGLPGLSFALPHRNHIQTTHPAFFYMIISKKVFFYMMISKKSHQKSRNCGHFEWGSW